MYVLILLLGLIVGNVGGFILALMGHVALDKNSVKNGIVKLCGDYYRIEKIEGNRHEN